MSGKKIFDGVNVIVTVRGMNKTTTLIHAKGWSLKDFLEKINRTDDWYYKHSLGGKDYDFLMLAIDGLEIKL